MPYQNSNRRFKVMGCGRKEIPLFLLNYITNPIIEISKVSERMAGLDFSMKSDLKRNDEVGVLSEMSFIFNQTGHLPHAAPNQLCKI